MRSGSELLAIPLCVLAIGCDREGRTPSEGAAKPLVLASATTSPSAGAGAGTRPKGALGCVPGAHRCVGEKLEACDATAGGFVQINVCQTSAHCNAKLKQCLVDPCILGEHQCNDSDLEQCHANGWTRVRQCDSPEACDAEHGQCRDPD